MNSLIDLKSSRPEFIEIMDNAPDRAFKLFYEFATAFLKIKPPRPMLCFNPDEREDLISDIIYHCVKDNFRVLKIYVDKGKPFACWLYMIAHNKSLDRVGRRRLEGAGLSIDYEGSRERAPESSLVDRSPNPDFLIELVELKEMLQVCLDKIGDKCRLLLEMAADELTPKEMTSVLRLPESDNKKIGTDLRDCRRKLKKLLEKYGINLNDYFPKSGSQSV